MDNDNVENLQETGGNPAYLMAYFRSGPNQTEMTRELHYAFSRNGLQWYELNDNKAVWATPIGGRIIRDPYIGKGPDGDYHLVHTMHSLPDSPRTDTPFRRCLTAIMQASPRRSLRKLRKARKC